MNAFTDENTSGYSDDELEWLNDRMYELWQLYCPHLDDPESDDSDLYKRLCEMAIADLEDGGAR